MRKTNKATKRNSLSDIGSLITKQNITCLHNSFGLDLPR